MKIGLSDPARRNLARQCRESVNATRQNRWGAWLAGRGWGLSPRPLEVRLAAGALALLLVLVSVVWMAEHETARLVGVASSPLPTPVPAVQLVRVAPTAAGGVTLEWQDGNRRVYNVLRSTDPRGFCGAEAHAVLGNHWTDESPAPDGVVYYRVEQAF